MKQVPSPLPRRFAATDAVILLAALALGVAWVSQTRPLLVRLAEGNYLVLRHLIHPAAAFFVPLTLALLIVRLRRPRPSLASCFRQPGVVACSVVAIFLVLEVLNHFLDLTYRLYDVVQLDKAVYSYKLTLVVMRGLTLFDSIAFSTGAAPGLAAAGAYLALWSAGLWRTEPSWIDRAGRLLGWFWIIAGVAFTVLPPWSPY